MSFDYTSLSAAARTRYIRIGRQLGSTDTLVQVSKTFSGLSKHADDLIRHGFVLADGAQLKNAPYGLVEEGIGRAGEVGAKKNTNKTHVDAIRAGKDERVSAHAILSGAARVLIAVAAQDRGGPDAVVAMSATIESLRKAAEAAAPNTTEAKTTETTEAKTTPEAGRRESQVEAGGGRWR